MRRLACNWALLLTICPGGVHGLHELMGCGPLCWGDGGELAGGLPIGDCGGGLGGGGVVFEGGGDGAVGEGAGVGGDLIHAVGELFEVAEVLFEHVQETFFCEGFGEDVVHAWVCVSCKKLRSGLVYTMLKVHRNVITTDVRGHGYDWSMVKLPYQMSCRDAVKIWHNDVHKYQVVLGACVHLIHSFQTIKLNLLALPSTTKDGARPTALSIAQWNEYKNFPPILRHVGSSSTSKI